jgi:hypothetical protein
MGIPSRPPHPASRSTVKEAETPREDSIMRSDHLTTHLRELAGVARVLEKDTTTAKCRRVMADLAADYESLARYIDEHGDEHGRGAEARRGPARAEASC